MLLVLVLALLMLLFDLRQIYSFVGENMVIRPNGVWVNFTRVEGYVFTHVSSAPMCALKTERALGLTGSKQYKRIMFGTTQRKPRLFVLVGYSCFFQTTL